jgi:hypothetical protein
MFRPCTSGSSYDPHRSEHAGRLKGLSAQYGRSTCRSIASRPTTSHRFVNGTKDSGSSSDLRHVTALERINARAVRLVMSGPLDEPSVMLDVLRAFFDWLLDVRRRSPYR